MAPSTIFHKSLFGVLIAIAAIQANELSNRNAQTVLEETYETIMKPITLLTEEIPLHRNLPVSRVVSDYKITAILNSKPRFRHDNMALTVMSFVVKDYHVTQEISDSIIECLAAQTITNPANWGIYNAEQFAAGMIQVEYFAFVDAGRISTFRTTVKSFGVKKQLPGCVRARIPDFSSEADIVSGRSVTEVSPNELGNGSKGTPLWAIIVITFLVLFCCALLVVWITLRKKRLFKRVALGDDSVLVHAQENQTGGQGALEGAVHPLAYCWQ